MGTARSTDLDHDSLPRVSFAVVTADGLNDISSVRHQAFSMTVPCPVEDVKDFYYIPDSSKNVRPGDCYAECLKFGLRARKSLEKVVAFLSGNADKKTVEMVVGKSAIIEWPRFEGKGSGKTMHSEREIVVFCESSHRIQSSASHSLFVSDDTQYLSLRSSGLKAKDKIETFSSVNILSGMCLFSQEHLRCLHGESVLLSDSEIARMRAPLPLDLRPTLYEIESLVRLPIAIANVVSTLPATLDVTITVEVPRTQYYAFQLDLYSRGLCSREFVDTWLDAVDKRHSQIAKVFGHAVQDALHRRGVGRSNVKVELSTGLEGIVPYIRAAIDQDDIPNLSVENLLQELLRVDPLFREYYEHLLPSQRPPQSLVDLCYSSYTFQVLRPIFRRVLESQLSDVQMNSPLERQLLINIDNVTEVRIYTQARKILKEYQKKNSSVISSLLLGIFPRELVFTAENAGRTNLHAKNIGQYIYDQSGGGTNTVSPGDIVAKVYGVDVTRRVVNWMTQGGMFDMSSMLAMSSGISSGGVQAEHGFREKSLGLLESSLEECELGE